MSHMVCNIPYIYPKKLTTFELRFNNLDFTCKTNVEQGIQVSYKFFVWQNFIIVLIHVRVWNLKYKKSPAITEYHFSISNYSGFEFQLIFKNQRNMPMSRLCGLVNHFKYRFLLYPISLICRQNTYIQDNIKSIR